MRIADAALFAQAMPQRATSPNRFDETRIDQHPVQHIIGVDGPEKRQAVNFIHLGLVVLRGQF